MPDPEMYLASFASVPMISASVGTPVTVTGNENVAVNSMNSPTR